MGDPNIICGGIYDFDFSGISPLLSREASSALWAFGLV
jgi:hypothetical protein